MTARDLGSFKRFLDAKHADLDLRIERTRGRLMQSEGGDALDRVRFVGERESAASELALEMRLRERVQGALDEIDAGTFGRCAACDREIPLRRLKAVPWSPYCLVCQEAFEAGGEPLPEGPPEGAPGALGAA